MLRRIFLTVLVVLAFGRAHAQGVLGDVFSGKLINPEVGVWAWYELTDKASGAKFYLRQAIVGAEQVKKKDGFWVETELVPQEGFPTIYKMLLTGPASDPKNVHQLFLKDGNNPPESVPVPQDGMPGSNGGDRKLVGAEKVKIASGEEFDTQHYAVGAGDNVAEVWLNDSVRPLGIVKMASNEGELVLQRSGTGGKDATSVIDAYAKELIAPGSGDNVRVEVRVNGEKKDQPKAKAAESPAPAEEKPSAASPKPAKKSKAKEKKP